jgi:hypothetical protein
MMQKHMYMIGSLVLSTSMTIVGTVAQAKPPGISNSAPFKGGAWGLGDAHTSVGTAAAVALCNKQHKMSKAGCAQQGLR